MQATHVSRSRIARQMTSKERCAGQKSRRAREMQALGAVAALLHSSAYRPAVRALVGLLRRCKRIDIHKKRRMRQRHTLERSRRGGRTVKRPADHVFE